MSRRDRIDPETSRLVEERLQWLLTEHGPRPDPPAAAAGRRSRPPEPTTAEDAEPSALPEPSGLPGRERRPRSSDDRAQHLSAMASFRRPHLVIVGAIVALGILLAGWAVLRARPVAVAVTPPPAVSATTATAPSGSGGSPGPTLPPVVVHVLGAVKKPGLVTLPAGSRVQDALDASGGLTSKADPGELNLAQPVADGQQIVVGTKGKPSGEVRDGSGGGPSAGGSEGTGSGSGGSPGGSGQPVNLNTANQAQLEELPGVGPVMAGKIIAWRTEHGRFSRVEELQEIDGVGPKTYAKLAPLCRV